MASADPNLSQCLAALDSLNGADTAPATRHDADRWLIQFQQSSDAWRVAHQLLHQQGLPEYTHYYAASTLYGKLLFHFGELRDATWRAQFKQSLRAALVSFSGSSKVRTRLAMCVAALGVQLMALGEWNECVQELITELMSNPATSLMLLDILAFLPEECNNVRLRISQAGRAQAQVMLLQSCTRVMELLQQALATTINMQILLTPNEGQGQVLLPASQAPQLALQEKVLRTFLAWIKASGHARRTMPAAFVAAPSALPSPTAAGTPNPAAAAAAFSHASNPLANSSLLIAHPLLLFSFKVLASRVKQLEQVAIDVLGSLLKNFNLESRHRRGGFRGFRQASQFQDDEREEGQVDPYDQPQRSPSSFSSASGFGFPASSPSNAAAAASADSAPSQYEHIYFMRFMLSRILALVPLFEALHPTDVGVSDLARCYARLFVDLGEYYLDFVMEFCIGARGFQTPHERAQLLQLARSMIAFAYLAQSQPLLKAGAAGTPVPAVEAHPEGFQLPGTDARLTVKPSDLEFLLEDNQSLAMQIVLLLRKCSAHPRREVHSHTFYFWFRLSDALVAPVAREHMSRNNSGSAGDSSLAAANARLDALSLGVVSDVSALKVRDAKQSAFREPFTLMIANLHRIITYPAGQAPELPPPEQGQESEEQEEVERARYHAAECLIDIGRLLGFTAIFSSLCSGEVLGQQFGAFAQAPAQHWRPVEASLFCIRRLAEPVLEHMHDLAPHVSDAAVRFEQGGPINSLLLPQILQALLPANSPVLQCAEVKVTAISLIGAYSAWIAAHDAARDAELQRGSSSKPDYLLQALTFVVASLREPRTCVPAARAFRHLCESNRDKLTREAYLPQLIQVFNEFCSVTIHGSGRSPQTGHSLEEQKQIIEGVAFVVSSVGNPQAPEQDMLLLCMTTLMRPMVEGLTAICSAVPAGQPLSADAASLVASHLDRLGETFARLNPSLNPNVPHFISMLLRVAQQVAQPLFVLMQRFDDDERRMDKLCRVFKWFIKTTRLHMIHHGGALLPTLIQHLVAAFQRRPHACFLYLFSVLVDSFGMVPVPGTAPQGDFVRAYLRGFLELSLPQMASTEMMAHNPDMTEDFFETCAKVLKTCPEKFFEMDPTLHLNIIQRAMLALPLHHRNSLSSASNFLSLYLEHGVVVPGLHATPVVPAHQKLIGDVVTQVGGEVVRVIVNNIAGALPVYRLQMMTGLMENLIAFCGPERMGHWLTAALAPVPPTVDPTKDEFRAELLALKPHAHGSWNRLNDIIGRFADAARIIQDAPR